jgi:hypothetical protein
MNARQSEAQIYYGAQQVKDMRRMNTLESCWVQLYTLQSLKRPPMKICGGASPHLGDFFRSD